ncbi:DNA helicase-2 / ATP-dependent DNA helicase PcrA [Sediminibacterium ginsengisoli]|uniref:DNA 3'-5' helicase n=2 Tax=Sediminibacterium ginsengisoli TaxID=413434 RepID=A0A1T4NFL1_9BACT|nr:DNA helicase-2 / ATP-dependent DNA helicase PcrA [Sediminibacterium ginsengisoli]
MLQIDEKRRSILATTGHLLVEGGPGSGKTTISLLKAGELALAKTLLPSQKVLFLSFARATISRIIEHAGTLIEKEAIKSLEINTYHGFTWELIKSYGYLASQQRCLTLVTPPEAAALSAHITEDKKREFEVALFKEHGRLCFDLFAPIAGEILASEKIASLVSNKYPLIIVDEFQDTNIDEWNIIKLIGKQSTIVALADPRQRIYDFRGSSITRIPEFISEFSCTKVDLGYENFRSGGTDIAQFGDDLLTGRNKNTTYNKVIINKYSKNWQDSYAALRYEVLRSIDRLKKGNVKNWSIAILVKSGRVSLAVSRALSTRVGGIPAISHEVLIDPSGPSLAAKVIAFLLEPIASTESCRKSLLLGIIQHLRGRKNGKPSQADLTLATALEKYHSSGVIRGSTRVQLAGELLEVVEKRQLINFTGTPADDWLLIRKLFENCSNPTLKNIFEDALYVRLLNKGALLNESLSERWRNNGSYQGASGVIESALLQEHFSMSNRKWNGIFIMTIHKSKGKEFDEVIIWEDEFKRLVPNNANETDIDRTKLALRVAVTRAKRQTTILTPISDPCVLL